MFVINVELSLGKSNDTPIEAYNCPSDNPSLFVDASVVVVYISLVNKVVCSSGLHFTGQQGGV